MRPPGRLPPDDLREWLRRARSNLALARAAGPDVYLEDLCFEAQQAVKAVLIHRGREAPRVHDLAQLLSLVGEAGEDVPEEIREAVELSPYAVLGRYPGHLRPVTEQEHEQAVALAERVVQWAEQLVAGGSRA